MSKLSLAEQRKGDLIEAAKQARENAYAPYSRFRVGAAVLTGSGRIFTGSNVENVSYGLSICAERVAIGSMVAAGEREISAIAIVTTETLAFPCGACLQVIQEFAGDEPPLIIAAGKDGREEVRRLSECLPCAFKNFKPES